MYVLYMHLRKREGARKSNGEVRKGRSKRDRVRGTPPNFSCANL